MFGSKRRAEERELELLARIREMQREHAAELASAHQATRTACLLAWEKSADVIRLHGRNRELQRRLAQARSAPRALATTTTKGD